MKTIAAATLITASLAGPATAHADCGDPDQPPCSGPVPTVDQVVEIMNELTDPNIPAANKGDIVTPAFDDNLDQHVDQMTNDLGRRGVLPFNYIVTDIQPAPNNLAGATVANPHEWGVRGNSVPVVLAYQRGHWLMTRKTAYDRLYYLWRDSMHLAGGI